MEQEQYYYTKYLKYKAKYLNLIKQTGGEIQCSREVIFPAKGRTLKVCCKTNAAQYCAEVASKNEAEDKTKFEELQNQLAKKSYN